MRTGEGSAPPAVRRTRARRGGHGLVPAAVLLGAVGCAVLAVALVGRGGDPATPAIATTSVAVEGRPALLAVTRGRVWTAEVASGRLRVAAGASPAAGRRPRAVGARRELTTALEPDGGAVAVALAAADGGRGRVLRVAPSGRARLVARLGVAPRRVVVRPGAVVALGASRVERVPRGRGRGWARPVDGGVDVAVGGGSVWTVARAQGRSVVARWTPAGRRVGLRAVPGAATAVAVGGGAVWVAGGCPAGIVRAPIGAGPARCVRTGGGVADVAVAAGAVWALDADGRRLLRLAPASGDAEGVARLAGRPLALATGAGAVAVLLAGGRIVRVAAG